MGKPPICPATPGVTNQLQLGVMSGTKCDLTEPGLRRASIRTAAAPTVVICVPVRRRHSSVHNRTPPLLFGGP